MAIQKLGTVQGIPSHVTAKQTILVLDQVLFQVAGILPLLALIHKGPCRILQGRIEGPRSTSLVVNSKGGCRIGGIQALNLYTTWIQHNAHLGCHGKNRLRSQVLIDPRRGPVCVGQVQGTRIQGKTHGHQQAMSHQIASQRRIERGCRCSSSIGHGVGGSDPFLLVVVVVVLVVVLVGDKALGIAKILRQSMRQGTTRFVTIGIVLVVVHVVACPTAGGSVPRCALVLVLVLVVVDEVVVGHGTFVRRPPLLVSWIFCFFWKWIKCIPRGGVKVSDSNAIKRLSKSCKKNLSTQIPKEYE